jgi:plasmid stabilization system protein ParE
VPSTTFRVEISRRAERDIEQLYVYIQAANSPPAAAWFNGLQARILSLQNNPQRGTITPESGKHRQILHGRKPHFYRIIYAINLREKVVHVQHIRHGARSAVGKQS